MHEFELIKKYFSKLSHKSTSSLNLNDDVFFDKKNKIVVTVDTYNEGKHFVNFKALGLFLVSFWKYFLINSNSSIRNSNFF